VFPTTIGKPLAAQELATRYGKVHRRVYRRSLGIVVYC
jgi:hypothetical protein